MTSDKLKELLRLTVKDGDGPKSIFESVIRRSSLEYIERLEAQLSAQTAEPVAYMVRKPNGDKFIRERKEDFISLGFKEADIVALGPVQLSNAEQQEKRDWVACPVCGENHMRRETDKDGNALIFCVNHGCKSNGGKTEQQVNPSGEQIAWNVWNDCHYVVRQSTDITQATWSLTLQREQIVKRAQSKVGAHTNPEQAEQPRLSNERELFEAHIRSTTESVPPNNTWFLERSEAVPDMYYNQRYADMWKGWKAALSAQGSLSDAQIIELAADIFPLEDSLEAGSKYEVHDDTLVKFARSIVAQRQNSNNGSVMAKDFHDR